MSTENKELPIDENSKNKPVQEDKPSSQQRPMGDADDIKKHDDIVKEKTKDKGDTNSVGIKKD
ncbi:MAG: hypothetical protein JWQ38_1098 [Flavipsychrobacter sp.]|nr:hypothetical protein [Flavipsychrobacter sp.]